LEITATVNLERELIRHFKGKCLEEALRGKIVSNEYGDCYLITDECISEFRKVDYDNLAGFCKNEDLAIIDIETLGLSFENPIILLGIANIRKNRTCIHQFLLRDISDEPGAIWSFLSHVENGSTLITYNGRSFDIPYIKQRLSYYGMEASLNNHHYDILHFTRRALGKKLPNCCLQTVEKYFGVQRGTDCGWVVPHFYNTYLETGNVGPLVAIVKHNKQDIINLGIVASRLYDLRNPRSEKESVGYAQEKQARDAYGHSPLRPPKPLSVSYPRGYFLEFLNLESMYNISRMSIRVKAKGTPHWWERCANKPYKCSACNGIIDSGERYIGRKQLIPGMRGTYGHKGSYVIDFYHIICLLKSTRNDVVREIEKAKARINVLEHDITVSKLKITDNKKRIAVCADEKCEARKNYETVHWWRKVDRWFSFQFTSIARDREVSSLNREIVVIENRQIPERRVEIDNLQRQMETLTVRLKEIESKIQELINVKKTGFQSRSWVEEV
jgi:uncharacterized protein YprB with RNaseH-like and TPR domain